MGMLLRSELVTEILNFFANRDDVTSARVITWLNIAQTRISRLHTFEELEVISYDTTSYTGVPSDDKFFALPADTRKILSLRLIDGTNSRKLVGYIHSKFDSEIPYPERYSTGRPSIYTRWGNQVELWRVPDDNYRIEIRRAKKPTDFNSDSDVVSDFEDKDDALIMLAVSWGHLSFRNMDDARTYWSIYKNMINDAIGQEVEVEDIHQVAVSMQDGIPISQPWSDPFVRSVD